MPPFSWRPPRWHRGGGVCLTRGQRGTRGANFGISSVVWWWWIRAMNGRGGSSWFLRATITANVREGKALSLPFFSFSTFYLIMAVIRMLSRAPPLIEAVAPCPPGLASCTMLVALACCLFWLACVVSPWLFSLDCSSGGCLCFSEGFYIFTSLQLKFPHINCCNKTVWLDKRCVTCSDVSQPGSYVGILFLK